MEKMIGWFKNVTRSLDVIKRQNAELLWADIFNSTVCGSEWFSGSISPGRWAVGYPFLYALYRVLDEMKPNRILELGLGQSSKMVCRYVETKPEVKHYVIEHNPDWIEFFERTISTSEGTKVLLCPMSVDENNGRKYYSDFERIVPKEKWNLIIVDAPLGSEHDSRSDILKVIPECLADDFVILFDDYERAGEKETCAKLESKLNLLGVDFCKGVYSGEKDMLLIASKSFSYFCSM